MHKTVKNTYIFFLLLLSALIIGLFYRQVLSDNLANHPGNKRVLINQEKTVRGKILASDLTILAKTVKQDDIYRRLYPGGSVYAHLTGYFSLVKGAAGLELTQNYWLGANRPVLSFKEWLNSQAGANLTGDDIVLTINPKLQRLAASLLANSKGAIVILEPKTGAVLALASSPTFDPNLLMQNKLTSLDNSYLLNRATSGLYPPGSVFKMVTLAAALENHVASLESLYNGPATLSVYGGKVRNFADQQHGQMSLKQAFAKSTNTIFAQVGLEVGAEKLLNQAMAFNLAKPVQFELPVAKGQLPSTAMDKLELAWTSVGQGKTLVTPLQIAMVAAAIANEGQLMQPYLVKEVRTQSGVTLKKTYPQSLGQAISKTTAKLLTEAMVNVVEQGTGQAAKVKSVRVAGKTGSAEVGGSLKPHAWFAGFAPADKPQVAIAVIIENSGLGGQIAAPKAARLFKAALYGPF